MDQHSKCVIFTNTKIPTVFPQFSHKEKKILFHIIMFEKTNYKRTVKIYYSGQTLNRNFSYTLIYPFSSFIYMYFRIFCSIFFLIDCTLHFPILEFFPQIFLSFFCFFEECLLVTRLAGNWGIFGPSYHGLIFSDPLEIYLINSILENPIYGHSRILHKYKI